MSVTLYIPSQNFSYSTFLLNDDNTGIAFAGFINGPVIATTVISNDSTFNFSCKATFGSGGGCDDEDGNKGHKPHVGSKVPGPKAKNPYKVELQKSLSPIKAPPKGNHQFTNPILKSKQTKDTFDPSGINSGNYSLVHQPWPSGWSVYLVMNNQLGPNMYAFNEAGIQATGPYDIMFQVVDFTTSGTLYQMTNQKNYTLSPNYNQFFHYTQFV